MPPAIDFQEAVFIAALPYRKSVYACGGFAQTAGPAAPRSWQKFLHLHFSPRDLASARKAAEPYLRGAEAGQAWWDSPELERRTGLGRMHYCTIWDHDYPRRLRFCYDPPPVLFYAGHLLSGLHSPGIFEQSEEPSHASLSALAVVGTRQAHPLAGEAAREYVRQLSDPEFTGCGSGARGASAAGSQQGPVIISGLALGIDRLAHEAAIDAGLPGIAVLGAGLLHAGPAANLDLPIRARERRSPFALVSEFPPHTPARAAHFPRRNRVIAGLAQRVAVLQAPLRSGAMITARFALDEGRDVHVFDHEILRLAGGCNDGARQLLESGARPIRLPGLEARLHKEPPFRPEFRAQRLALWKEVALGRRLRWLGGRYYLEAEAA